MPKRKTDPTTGQSQLTYREQMLVNEFINNGGNGARAAAAAGYKAARLDQAAYQALHRDCVQQHIRERIRESCVSSDEIVGTVASHMRANVTEFFDESGNFSIEIAKQKGIGHLIKSISGTICDPPDPNDPDDQIETQDALNTEGREYPEDHESDPTQLEPANMQTCKHCGRRPPKRSNPPARKRRTPPRQPSFRIQLHSPLQAASILARLIGIDRHHPYRPLNQPATRNRQPATSRDFDPNALLQSLIEEQMKEHGLSREAVTNRILQVRPEFAKYLDELPPPPSLLDQLSLRDTGKILAPVLDAIAFLKSNVYQLPPGHPDPGDYTPTVDSDASDSFSSCQSETHHSPPETHPYDQNAATAPPAPTTPPSPPLAQDHSATLQPAQPQQSAATHAPSDSQPATCNLQPATDSQPATDALESFRRTYAGITRPFQFGLLDNHFTEVIDRIMREQSLTPQHAIDAIWLAARQSTWSSANLIDQCIADFAALHPRLAHAQPPVCARRPPSPPRYYRPGTSLVPASLDPCSDHEVDDSDDDDCVQDSGILTSTQLFRPRAPTIRSG